MFSMVRKITSLVIIIMCLMSWIITFSKLYIININWINYFNIVMNEKYIYIYIKIINMNSILMELE